LMSHVVQQHELANGCFQPRFRNGFRHNEWLRHDGRTFAERTTPRVAIANMMPPPSCFSRQLPPCFALSRRYTRTEPATSHMSPRHAPAAAGRHELRAAAIHAPAFRHAERQSRAKRRTTHYSSPCQQNAEYVATTNEPTTPPHHNHTEQTANASPTATFSRQTTASFHFYAELSYANDSARTE